MGAVEGHVRVSASQGLADARGMKEADDAVDIRELKLLAEFSHPNIVKFVSGHKGWS